MSCRPGLKVGGENVSRMTSLYFWVIYDESLFSTKSLRSLGNYSRVRQINSRLLKPLMQTHIFSLIERTFNPKHILITYFVKTSDYKYAFLLLMAAQPVYLMNIFFPKHMNIFTKNPLIPPGYTTSNKYALILLNSHENTPFPFFLI